MSECISCKTLLPDDATFCSSCGRAQTLGQGTPGQGAPLIDPAARRAATAAAQSAQALVAELGVERVLCIVGALLGILGALLPYVSLSIPSGSLAVTLSGLTVVNFGLPGVLVIIVAILLGGAPFIFRPSRAIALAGVGLSTIVLAKLFSDWFTIGMLQSIIQMSQAMSAASNSYGGQIPAGMNFGGAAGFYCLFIGFAISFIAYVRSASA